MSYSFGFRVASAANIADVIDAEFDKIVEQQPTHAADREQAKAAALALAALLTEPSAEEDIYVSVSGSLTWRDEKSYVSASVNVHVSLAKKEQAA